MPPDLASPPVRALPVWLNGRLRNWPKAANAAVCDVVATSPVSCFKVSGAVEARSWAKALPSVPVSVGE